MVAVVVYLMTNAVDLVLFFVPAVSKYLETSNWRMCTTISRWTQVNIIPFLIYLLLKTCIVMLKHSYRVVSNTNNDIDNQLE